MKAKISPNLLSFPAIRRGEWILKVSVFKNKQVAVLAMNCYDMEDTKVRFFMNHNLAADFIEQLIIEE
jgi:hypothetical protein